MYYRSEELFLKQIVLIWLEEAAFLCSVRFCCKLLCSTFSLCSHKLKLWLYAGLFDKRSCGTFCWSAIPSFCFYPFLLCCFLLILALSILVVFSHNGLFWKFMLETVLLMLFLWWCRKAAADVQERLKSLFTRKASLDLNAGGCWCSVLALSVTSANRDVILC